MRLTIRNPLTWAALGLLSIGVMLSTARSGPNDPPKDPKDKPDAKQPAQPGDGEVLISNMRVQDFPGGKYFYTATKLTIPQIGEFAGNAIPALITTIRENRINVAGPEVFVYQGMSEDMTKEFDLEIGFMVDAGTKEVGDYKVRDLAPFHCATVIYSGPVTDVGKAYQEIFTQIFAAGMRPTGEVREMYLYWESPESPNNIEVIMVGVAK